MIVPAGGISLDGTRWVPCRPGFFLPVRVLSACSGRLFLAGLVDAHAAGRLAFFDQLEGLRRREAFAAHLAPLRRKKWFLYAKPPPCADPEAVLAYLARYTHRVAISNSRLLGLDETRRDLPLQGLPPRRPGAVAHHDARPRRVHQALPAPRLPKGFHRIRHYGLLASATCKKNVARARELIAMPCRLTDPPVERDEADPAAGAAADHRPPCPCCGGRMIIVGTFERRRCNPAPRRRPLPGSGPRCHDPRHRLIAPPTSRETSPPASQHY